MSRPQEVQVQARRRVGVHLSAVYLKAFQCCSPLNPSKKNIIYVQ